jgi:hypothetical protein
MIKKVYTLTKIIRKTNRYGKDFSFYIENIDLGIFSSKKQSEKFIQICVEGHNTDNYIELVGFFIKEIIIDRLSSKNDIWDSIYEKIWSYTKDGKIFSYSLFSSDWNEQKYFGTPDDAIKFKIGDYAWKYAYDKMILVKIVNLPYNQIEWKNKFNFMSDGSDDCYTVVTTNSHCHPLTCTLFPIDKVIPKKIISLINKSENNYFNGKY